MVSDLRGVGVQWWIDRAVEAERERDKLREQLVKARETLKQANAFIIATHLSPAIHTFEIEARQKHYDALIKRIDTALSDDSGKS